MFVVEIINFSDVLKQVSENSNECKWKNDTYSHDRYNCFYFNPANAWNFLWELWDKEYEKTMFFKICGHTWERIWIFIYYDDFFYFVYFEIAAVYSSDSLASIVPKR